MPSNIPIDGQKDESKNYPIMTAMAQVRKAARTGNLFEETEMGRCRKAIVG